MAAAKAEQGQRPGTRFGPRPGGGPGQRHHGAMAKPQSAGKALKRLLTYMKGERLLLILVFLAIIVSSAAGVAGTYLLKPLINGYIVPFIGKENPDLSGFAGLLFFNGEHYMVGALSTYAYSSL